MNKTDFNDAIPSIRFIAGDMCHAGQIGGITHHHLLSKNSGTVLAEYAAKGKGRASMPGLDLKPSKTVRRPARHERRRFLSRG